MSHIFGTDVDFNSNEAKKFRVENLLNFPTVGAGDVGRIFSHTGQNTFYGWNGNSWLDLALSGGGGGYTLPTATDVILGGVKIDANTINIDGNGVISASGWTDPTGLEAIDEGNWFGWRFIGRDPSYYGNIGYDAKDFGVNYALNSTLGATGSLSVNFSEDGLITGYGAFAGTGYNLQLTNTYTTGFGYYNISNGYSSFIAGVWNVETNSKGFNFTAGHSNHTNQIAGFSAGAALLKGTGVGCAVLGAANIDIASAQSGTDVNAPMIIIGNGTHTTPDATAWAATVRSNLFVGYRNGEVVLPSTTIAIIDAESTGRQLLTKEWYDAKNIVSGFQLRDSSGQSIPNASWTKVTFLTEDSDPDNAVSASTFTVPAGKGGKFSVSGLITFDTIGDTSNCIASIYKNGALFNLVARGLAGGTGLMGLSGAMIIDLVDGDTIEFYAYQASGGAIALRTDAGYNHFEAYRIGDS
jgi:hypothetical protein